MPLRHHIAFLSAAVLIIAPMSVSAQSISLSSSPTAVAPDVHALRYYAKNGDNQRYQLELERLRRIYPGYEPPADLLSDPVDENQALWDLYGSGDFETLQTKIEERRETDPTWTPDLQLSAELRRRDDRSELVAAFREFNFDRVKELADANPALINPDDPEVVWAIAETFAMEKDYAAANEAFRFAVNTAKTPEVKAGALQKAAQHMPIADSSALYEAELAENAGEPIVRDIQIGYARGLVIRSNQYGYDFPPQYVDIIDQFLRTAMENEWQQDIDMLSWTLYNQKKYRASLALFTKSLELEESLKTVEGQLLSMKFLDMIDQARPIATRYRDQSTDIAALYLNLWAPELLTSEPRALDPSFIQTYAMTTTELSSGEGAEALGWYAFNVRQYPVAHAWFSKAMEWEPTETAAYGLVLIASIEKNRDEFDRLRALYGVEYASVLEVQYEEVIQQAAASQQRSLTPARRAPTRAQGIASSLTAAHDAKQYTRCVELSDRQIASGTPAPRDWQMRGWCLMGLDRHAEAQKAFQMAVSTDRTQAGDNKRAASYGASLAALESGRTDEAYAIANSNSLQPIHRMTVNKEILTQRAIAAFRSNDYRSTLYSLNELRKIAAEPRNLALLRGWSLYYLGDRRGALNVFAAIDGTYSTKESRNALTTVQQALGVRTARRNQ